LRKFDGSAKHEEILCQQILNLTCTMGPSNIHDLNIHKVSVLEKSQNVHVKENK